MTINPKYRKWLLILAMAITFGCASTRPTQPPRTPAQQRQMEVGPVRHVIARVLLWAAIVTDSDKLMEWSLRVGRGTYLWWG